MYTQSQDKSIITLSDSEQKLISNKQEKLKKKSVTTRNISLFGKKKKGKVAILKKLNEADSSRSMLTVNQMDQFDYDNPVTNADNSPNVAYVVPLRKFHSTPKQSNRLTSLR